MDRLLHPRAGDELCGEPGQGKVYVRVGVGVAPTHPVPSTVLWTGSQGFLYASPVPGRPGTWQGQLWNK